MLEIDGKIISREVLEQRFCCDLKRCAGICCVEGNAGAPLELEEVDTLEETYEQYKPYLKPEGICALETQGFMVVDTDGDYTTPLIDQAECAYSFSENGITYCAIERAYRNGKISFQKPISCHLYPIRVKRFSNGTYGLNYHHWDVCTPAVQLGQQRGIPMYQSLREPLVRMFGEPFYEALDQAAQLLSSSSK